MKQFLLQLLSSVFVLNLVNAQSKLSSYRVDYRVEPYVDITPDSVLWENEFWIDSMYRTGGWGWDIPLQKQVYNPLINYSFNTFAYRVYKGTVSIYGDDYSLLSKLPDCFMREFSDSAPYQTKISYQFDTSGNVTIFKLQVKQLGITDSTFQTKGYLNMQFWFYDGGVIELRYGPNSIPPELLSLKQPLQGKYKPTIGVAQYVDTLQSHNVMLVGPYDNPRFYNGKNKPFFDMMRDSALSQFPPSGTVYRFTTWKVGLKNEELSNQRTSILPNPFINEIHIDIPSSESLDITLTDAMGKTMGSYINQTTIETQHLSAGVYFLTIKYKTGEMANFKILKANQ